MDSIEQIGEIAVRLLLTRSREGTAQQRRDIGLIG